MGWIMHSVLIKGGVIIFRGSFVSLCMCMCECVSMSECVCECVCGGVCDYSDWEHEASKTIQHKPLEYAVTLHVESLKNTCKLQ